MVEKSYAKKKVIGLVRQKKVERNNTSRLKSK